MIAAIASAVVLLAGAPKDVEVVGMDYAFRVPDRVAAGPTTFRFVNRGKHAHELNIALLKRGVTQRQFMTALNAGKPVRELIDVPVGVLFAEPGARAPGALTAELLAGRDYVVVCIFKDDPKAPRHHQIGMFSLIHPVASPAAPLAGKVDTVIGRDYAFTLPPTLAPGRHRFRFVNAGKQRHEFSLARLKPGVTLAQLRAVEAKDGDVEPLFDQSLGLLHGYGGITPAGLLDVELVAGREYVYECAFKDDEKAPEHFKLGMSGSFRVRAKP